MAGNAAHDLPETMLAIESSTGLKSMAYILPATARARIRRLLRHSWVDRRRDNVAGHASGTAEIESALVSHEAVRAKAVVAQTLDPCARRRRQNIRHRFETVLLSIASIVSVDRAQHCRPWFLDDQVSASLAPTAFPSRVITSASIPGNGLVPEPGFVGVGRGSGVIMIAPVSVCHQVSTIGQRFFPMMPGTTSMLPG